MTEGEDEEEGEEDGDGCCESAEHDGFSRGKTEATAIPGRRRVFVT